MSEHNFIDFMDMYNAAASYSPGISVYQTILAKVPMDQQSSQEAVLTQLFNFEMSKRAFPLVLEDENFYSWQRMDNFIRTYLGKNFDVTLGNDLLQSDFPAQNLSKDISKTEYVCYLYMIFLIAMVAGNYDILNQFKKPTLQNAVLQNVVRLFNINISDMALELSLLRDTSIDFLLYFRSFIRSPIGSVIFVKNLIPKLLEAGYEFKDYVAVSKNVDPEYFRYFFELYNFPLYDDEVISQIDSSKFRTMVMEQRKYYRDANTRKLAFSLKKKLDSIQQELAHLQLVLARTTDPMVKSVMSISIEESQKQYSELLKEYLEMVNE